MEIKELEQLLKLLANETRLRILNIISNNESSVSEICESLNLNQPTVSKHLVKLRLFGIVTDTRDSSYVNYKLNSQQEEYVSLIKFLFRRYGENEVFENDRNLNTGI